MTSRSNLRFFAPALAFGLVLGAGGLQAQQAAPPAPMVLPLISPSHLAAARAVVISSGLSRSFDTIVPDLMGQLYANVTQTRPEFANDLRTVLSQLQPEFQKETAQIVDAAAQVVAAQIDENSLNQINTFFSSPVGKKYVNAQPDMLNHMMASIHDLTQQISEQMMTRVRDEMAKRGKQL